MATSSIIGGYLNTLSFNNFGSPKYAFLIGSLRTGSPSATETEFKQKIDAAGALSKFSFRVNTNAFSVSTALTVRVNSADGTQTVTVTAGATGQFQDSTHTDSVSAGDYLSLKVNPIGTFQNFNVGGLSLIFAGTSVTAAVSDSRDTTFGTSANGGTASATQYLPIFGIGDNTNGWFVASETNAKTLMRAAGDFTRLGVYVASNGSTNAVVLTLRKNGADGSNTVSITAATSGYFEDTTHSDTFASGDEVSCKCVTGAGTVNASMHFVCATFKSAASAFDIRSQHTRTAGQSWGTGAATYVAPFGGVDISATEATVQTKFPLAVTLSRLVMQVSAASGNSTATFDSRINGASGNLSVSITGATTGLFEDSTHSDTVAADDLMNWRLTAITGGTLSVRFVGAKADAAAAPAATVKPVVFVAT